MSEIVPGGQVRVLWNVRGHGASVLLLPTALTRTIIRLCQAAKFGFVVGDCLVGANSVDFGPAAAIEDVLPRLKERPLRLKIKALR